MTVASLPTTLEAGLRRVDELADRSFARWKVPGLVYGVIYGDHLVHTRGLGTLRVGEDATPDRDSVFRIASMTKSFTAATVLSLRDEGRLALDDPIARYVPELSNLRYPTADSPRITIRHLLTMTAGFPGDDPWGDRQQGLDPAEFSELLSRGLSFARAPGTRFEYSNTGYGILGRLITNVAGREYRDVVRDRILEPLGMTSTTYLEDEVAPDRLARGYLWRNGEFVDEPMDGYGALAPMGGIFTSVEDLATWVGGFIDAFPPRDDPDDRHPLSRASRREMQQPHVPAEQRVSAASVDDSPSFETTAYGFGLHLVRDQQLGWIITHGGGYPGFGSHMRWHPASGLGVIAFVNTRYGPAWQLAIEVLADLLRSESVPVRRVRPSHATLAARDAVEGLIDAWDEGLADRTFAMNVELDEPLALRRAAIEQLRIRHGRLERDPDEPEQSLTPFHLVWWLRGARGRVRVEILMSPEASPRVQTFALTSVPEPPPRLARAAERIVAALEAPAQGPVTIAWPADLAVSELVDLAAVVRAMRATEARFGPIRLGPCIDGDGETRATFRLRGPRGEVHLALTLDVAIGCLDAIALTTPSQVPPNLD